MLKLLQPYALDECDIGSAANQALRDCAHLSQESVVYQAVWRIGDTVARRHLDFIRGDTLAGGAGGENVSASHRL